MHKIYLCFKIVKNDCYLDTVFDTRLSLKDNFKALVDVYELDIDIGFLKVYDPYKKMMLDVLKPIDKYNLHSTRFLLLFWTISKLEGVN